MNKVFKQSDQLKKIELDSLEYAVQFALDNFNYNELCQKFPKGGKLSNEQLKEVIQVAVEIGYKIAKKKKMNDR